MGSNKRKRGSNTTSSSEAEVGGFIQIHFFSQAGVTYPHRRPLLFTPKTVAKCEDLTDVASFLRKNWTGLDHVRNFDVLFRRVDQEPIRSIEDFKACLSESTYTDPIIAEAPDRSVVGHEPAAAKKAEAEKLFAQYEAHAPSSLDAHTVRHLQESVDTNQQEVVVKFCKRYGDEVHKAWYNLGLAPELLEVQVLGGGYRLVVMEFLGPPWKPFLLLDGAEKKECRLVVVEALRKVHGLPVFGPPNPGSVHGDAREANIMVRRDEGVFKVKFIDLIGLVRSV